MGSNYLYIVLTTCGGWSSEPQAWGWLAWGAGGMPAGEAQLNIPMKKKTIKVNEISLIFKSCFYKWFGNFRIKVLSQLFVTFRLINKSSK